MVSAWTEAARELMRGSITKIQCEPLRADLWGVHIEDRFRIFSGYFVKGEPSFAELDKLVRSHVEKSAVITRRN